jgi:hypothetical protein
MGLELDKTYESLIGYLVEQQAAAAKAMAEQDTGRPWLNFSKTSLEQRASAKEESELHDVFSRDSVNETYVAARQNADAKAREVALAKMAGDFLAACERDKRMQWRSRIRIFAHSASRCAGNGAEAGPLRKSTVDFLQRIIMKARELEKTP